jgi:hypothetical protein
MGIFTNKLRCNGSKNMQITIKESNVINESIYQIFYNKGQL